MVVHDLRFAADLTYKMRQLFRDLPNDMDKNIIMDCTMLRISCLPRGGSIRFRCPNREDWSWELGRFKSDSPLNPTLVDHHVYELLSDGYYGKNSGR